jgi:molecular chaperone DnaK (HSP70)
VSAEAEAERETEAQFIVGIDLGTTHTVVAYAPIDTRRTRTAPEPVVMAIPQLVTPQASEDLLLLPSCLYAPIKGEIAGDPRWVTGEVARRRGAEVTGRFVASAKSWLSHAAVDRTAAILPWGAAATLDEGDDPSPKLSPVEASTLLLAHIVKAWDKEHPTERLAKQNVVLTLPASFDDVARELTLRAARAAGLEPTLLEEPTAAFYDAMRDVDAIREHVVPRSPEEEKTVLVCDVGGGTTDLSLMAIAYAPKDKGGFTVRRVAVGRHILLGGDNMDLALAHIAESRITGSGARLEASELAQLVLSCREAKERVLSSRGAKANEARVTVLGRGSKLIGGARSATLTREDVEGVVLQGFFPADVELTTTQKRAAIVAFGLPYERDPAVTRHIRQFLARHSSELGPKAHPDVILLNGGVFNAAPIVKALKAALKQWSGQAPAMLPISDPDLAVACGAVRYGFARHGLGVRVESGASRGYYVRVSDGHKENRAVCILPRGAKEGTRYEATERTFDLIVGRSVRFDLYASDLARDEIGTIVTIDDQEDQGDNHPLGPLGGVVFERLPPVVTHLPATTSKEQSVRVRLGGELHTTGQLELAATEISESGGGKQQRRFRLEFQLRDAVSRPQTSLPPASLSPSIAPQSAGQVRVSMAPTKLNEAAAIIEKVFGKKSDASPREVKDVLRDLEKTLNDRLTWTMETCRFVCDRLLINTGSRRRSPNHERAYWLLLGFCLRPGFGDPGDPSRIERAWPLFEGRLGFPNEVQGWQQFFIAWRRMAGGLTETMQESIRDAMDPIVAPKDAGLKPPKRVPEDGGEALVMLAALERVSAKRRALLGDWIVEKTWTNDDARLWTAIGRVGARVPVYASLHHVVPVRNAETWIERLLRLKWESVATAQHAAVQLSRVTGDRARDVSERLRKEVEKRLTQMNAKPTWITAVRELVEVGEEERVAILGEGLPIGLKLAG